MYTKEQASKLKTQFWTSFGQYMKPIPGASGHPVNWINYKTGVRYIQFKMDADNKQAVIAIGISHPKEDDRIQCFEQFIAVKNILNDCGDFDWQWNESVYTEHRIISSISDQLEHVNILNQDHWPAIISFLKPRIIALDAFWNIVKDGFE